MKASTLVQANASIITIVNLKEGDVYKRMEKKYDDTFELKFGVVTGVMANGEEMGITAIEFDGGYKSLTATIKTFGSNTELTIFHADPDEVSVHFDKLIQEGLSSIKEKHKELIQIETVLDQVQRVKDKALAGELTAPEHKVLTVNPDDVSE